MDYQLSVLKGRSASNVVKLSDGVTTVGRQDDCQLRINSSQVSRRHCEVFESQGQLMVKDLGSSNGTFINGQRVEKPSPLKAGDVLSVGQIKFRVEKIGQPAVPAQAQKVASSETAISEALIDDGGDDEGFELDFGDEPTVAPSGGAVDPNKPGTSPSTRVQQPSEPAAEPDEIPLAKEDQIGEDAAADFLMDLRIDEDD